ncbi:MAG: acyl carrier protein [Sphingobium sp.]|nr:acyl carrier protein [Sphingobium sp.]
MRDQSLGIRRDAPALTADEALRASLVAVLGLDAARVADFDEQTPLFGALPELDSMAVATLLTDFEDRLHIHIDDDDVDADMFETFGALRDFLARKIDTSAA